MRKGHAMRLTRDGESSPVFGLETIALVEGRTTLGQAIAQQIEDMIVDHHLNPGDRLPSERDLTRLYGMSRTVVRDAVATLAERGLLHIMPGKGIFVRQNSTAATRDSLSLLLRREQASPHELMQARQLLEEQTAYLAAQNATPEDINALRESLAEMRRCHRDPRRFVEADLSFHETLARAAGNRVLLSLLLSIHDLLQQSMLGSVSDSDALERNVTEHERVFAAVTAHDALAARQAMHEHLTQTYAEWVGAGLVPSL